MEKLPWYTLVLNWLNGNKTIFGIFLVTILAPEIPPDLHVWFVPVQTTVLWVGGLLSTAGIAHKIIKSDTSPEPNK